MYFIWTLAPDAGFEQKASCTFFSAICSQGKSFSRKQTNSNKKYPSWSEHGTVSLSWNFNLDYVKYSSNRNFWCFRNGSTSNLSVYRRQRFENVRNCSKMSVAETRLDSLESQEMNQFEEISFNECNAGYSFYAEQKRNIFINRESAYHVSVV
jgi:hypothetical protein